MLDHVCHTCGKNIDGLIGKYEKREDDYLCSECRALPPEPRTCETCKDWPEDAHLENGRYECFCTTCGKHFTGHKRRVTCKACATRSPQPADVETVRETRGIEIRNIRCNARHPGAIYGTLYIDGDLNLSATLSLCVERAGTIALDRIAGKEEL